MKTLKIALYAVLGIIGFVNASASAGKYVVGTLYHKSGPGSGPENYTVIDPNDEGEDGGWRCADPTTVTCLYLRESQSEPISDSNRTPASFGVFTPIPE